MLSLNFVAAEESFTVIGDNTIPDYGDLLYSCKFDYTTQTIEKANTEDCPNLGTSNWYKCDNNDPDFSKCVLATSSTPNWLLKSYYVSESQTFEFSSSKDIESKRDELTQKKSGEDILRTNTCDGPISYLYDVRAKINEIHCSYTECNHLDYIVRDQGAISCISKSDFDSSRKSIKLWDICPNSVAKTLDANKIYFKEETASLTCEICDDGKKHTDNLLDCELYKMKMANFYNEVGECLSNQVLNHLKECKTVSDTSKILTKGDFDGVPIRLDCSNDFNPGCLDKDDFDDQEGNGDSDDEILAEVNDKMDELNNNFGTGRIVKNGVPYCRVKDAFSRIKSRCESNGNKFISKPSSSAATRVLEFFGIENADGYCYKIC